MKKPILIVVLFGFLLGGCATMPPNSQCAGDGWGNIACNNYDVQFISDPPGARIEINNNYIGVTPLVHRWHGYYSYYSQYIVKAYPSVPGQYVQTKVLNISELPRTVYFDMNLAPRIPEYNININQ